MFNDLIFALGGKDMSLATASRYAPVYEELPLGENSGAAGLLQPKEPHPNHVARASGVAFYALALVAVITLGFRAQENPVEEQSVVELAPMPVDEPPPEEPLPPDEPDLPDPPPPEPQALEPLPVEKPPPKPIEKPRPKVEKPRPQVPHPAPAIPAARPQTVPPGATPSAIANHFHGCMQRAAANAYPDSQAPRTARVGYHVTFSATGSLLSFSITPSGNAVFDAIANRLGSRCSSVPAPGKTVSLPGSLTFSP